MAPLASTEVQSLWSAGMPPNLQPQAYLTTSTAITGHRRDFRTALKCVETHLYYRAWLDEQIPALGGRTPRHAAKLKTQRSKVTAMLREIEMHPMGQHVADMAWMWEELGLADLR